MRSVENLIGRRFGRLVVSHRVENNRRGNTVWLCICDCGKRSTVIGSALRGCWISSCGCASVETRTVHGHNRRGEKSSEYIIWTGMIKRCSNRNSRKFKDYGGRGITVCQRWRRFENFLADMGARPSVQHSLDRFPNNDGNYEPGNCRWATRKEQGRNTRSNHLVEFEGRQITVAEAAEIAGISYYLLHGRLRDGWSLERAMSTPRRPGRMDCLLPAELL